MNKKDTSNNKIQEINKNYLLKLFDFEALDKKKLIKNLEIGPEGFIIKNLRLYRKLTQKELANETGISENTIYNYESGKNKPNPNNWQKMVDFLEVDSEINKTINMYMFLQAHELEENRKKAYSKEDDILKIAEYINKFSDNVFKEIILPYIIEERKIRVFDIFNLLNAYHIATNNLRYSIKCELFLDEAGEEKNVFMIRDNGKDKGALGYGLFIDDFLDHFLIPLSNLFDYLIKNISDTMSSDYEFSENIFKNEYKILLDNIDGLSIEFDEDDEMEINYQNKIKEDNSNEKKLKDLSNEDLTKLIEKKLDKKDDLTDEEIDNLEVLSIELLDRMSNIANKNIEKLNNKEGAPNE